MNLHAEADHIITTFEYKYLNQRNWHAFHLATAFDLLKKRGYYFFLSTLNLMIYYSMITC